jgi:hypothetical protein
MLQNLKQFFDRHILPAAAREQGEAAHHMVDPGAHGRVSARSQAGIIKNHLYIARMAKL